MTKSPIIEFIAGKFNECKEAVNEQMRKNAIIERVKRQILNASSKHDLKYQLVVWYYEAIYQLFTNLNGTEAEFCKALNRVMNKVENRIDKKEMICALVQFCSEHPAELSPGILYDYAERWHSIENNLFSLVNRINYKPFWDWMLKHKIEEFDLENIFEQNENSLDFEDIISWIASDEEYAEVFFESRFELFMEKILQYVEYSESYDRNDPLIVVSVGDGVHRALSQNEIHEIQGDPFTLAKAVDTICSILPGYEIRLLNYVYLYYFDEETDECIGVNDFIYILNRMADYEYATGEEVFCCTGKNEWPDMAYDGSVDVVEDAQDIILRHSYDMEVAEIVWILQNRFSIQESVINDAIAKIAIEVFDGGHLNSLVHNEKLAPLFQFPVAYNLFLFYFDDIVKKTAKYAFKELEEKYGIECEVVKI